MAGVPEMLALATLGYLINNKQKRKKKRTIENYEPVTSDTFNNFSSQEPNTNMLDTIKNITDNRKFESCIAGKTCKNEWMAQLDALTFDNKQIAEPSNGDYIARIDMERDGFSDFNLTGDGTYGIVKPDSNKFFQPGVMPNVRRGPHPINEQAKAEVNNQKLELFTGVNNADWVPKEERKPLFDPSVNKVDIYGMQPITDFEEKRSIVSSERRNERPFEQIRVTPGLNIKPNAVGVQGFHDPFRPTERTVDELRIASNPKVSYPSYTPPAGNSVGKRPKLGKVTQHSPPHYTGRNANDVVRSGVSEYSAPTIYGEVDTTSLATQNRGTKVTPTVGPAKYGVDGTTPGEFRGRYHDSTRQNFLSAPPTNVAQHEGMRGAGHNNASMVAQLTNRNMTEVNSYSGAAFAQEKIKSYDPNNILEPTQRNTYEMRNHYGQIAELTKQITPINYADTMDPTGRNLIENFTNGGFLGPTTQASKSVDFTDIPATTTRELYEHNKHGAHVTGQFNMPAINYNDVHDINIKTLTEANKYGGTLSGTQENVAVNFSDIPKNTTRSMTPGNKSFGQMGSYVPNVRAPNYNYVTDPTIREQTGLNKTSGTLTGSKQGNVIIDYNNVVKLTSRSIDPQNKLQGSITGHNGVTAIDYNDTTKPTMRNMTTNNKHAANVTGERHIGTNVNLDLFVQKPTMRDMYVISKRAGLLTNSVPQAGRHDTDYIPSATERSQRPGGSTGTIGTHVDNQVPRDKYENMMVNEGKEALEERPTPTTVGQNKGWSINTTAFHFRTRDNPEVIGLPESNIMYNNDRLEYENTKMPNKILPDTMRNIIPIEEVLKGNVYINNAIHMSLMKK